MENKENLFEKYFLDKDGKLYIASSREEVKPDKKHCFRLISSEGNKITYSLKCIYKTVYDRQFSYDAIEDLQNEEWKQIKDTKGIYWISNKGRMKSYHYYNARLLKPYITKQGYQRVDIQMNGNRQSIFVHRLVAAAFLPAPTSFEMHIHHIDFTKSNNCVDNLEWLTPLEHRNKHTDHQKELKEEKNG